MKLKSIIKDTAVILCAIFLIVSPTFAMEYFKGTPEELAEYKALTTSNDVLGAKIVRNITTHGTLSAQGNASSSFGNSLTFTTNNAYDLGFYDGAVRNIYASGTIYSTGISASGDLDPALNDTYDIGEYDLAWQDIFASGTLRSNAIINATTLSSGTGSDVDGVGTFYVDSTGNVSASGTAQFGSNVPHVEVSPTGITLRDGAVYPNLTRTAGGGLRISTNASVSSGGEMLSIQEGGVYSFTILGNGYVGVGTRNPGEKLEVLNGNIAVGDGSATSTLTNTTLALNDTLSDGVGTFYVDSTGNVSASGTIQAGNGGTSTSTVKHTLGTLCIEGLNIQGADTACYIDGTSLTCFAGTCEE